MEKYQIQREIGCGNFAKVYLATNTVTKQEVALKLVNKKELNAKACSRTRVEMANIKKITGHKNIVAYYETFETKKHFGIAMEYVPGGELFEYVRLQEGISESNAKEMFWEILEGVKHCHDSGIAHRDLKLENILLDKDNKPKIADFGFSKEITSESLIASSVGSLLYSSPEIVERKPYQGTECDIWSLGVILYIILTATMPFDDSNLGDFLVKISSGTYPKPSGVSDSVRDLISRMLNPDALTRYTMQDILHHPWLATAIQRSPQVDKHVKRRRGVCYKSSDTIRYALLKMNCCDCSCHKSGDSSNTRDSVVSRHCTDCSDVLANDPLVMQRRKVRLSRNSSISSGYGSEIGSQYLQTPSPDEPQVLGLDFYPILGRRSSVPRKSSASSASTVHAKSSFQRCSVPTRPTREYATGEDEDIVFV